MYKYGRQAEEETEQTRGESRGELCEKVRDLMAWIVLMVVVLGLGLAEAGRGLHPHPIFGALSRKELVDLAGYGEDKLSTVLITGAVLCPEHEGSSATSQPVSGVRVGVTCTSIKFTSEETSTDEFGDFTIDLPSHLHGTQNIDEACQVKLIQVPKWTFTKVEHSKVIIKLASARNGVRTYTTGKINLKSAKFETGATMTNAIIRLAKLPIEKWQG